MAGDLVLGGARCLPPPGCVFALVVIEAVRRLLSGTHEVHGLPVAVVSGTAAVAMAVGALILRADAADDEDEDGDRANMRAVLLDTVADAAAAGGVAVTGALIALTGGLYWLDPAVALGIGVVVVYHVAFLLRGVLRTLLRPTRL